MKDPKAPEKRRRKWLFRGLFLLAMLLIVVALAPWLIANTPLRNVIARQAAAAADMTASVEHLTCGWFTPLSIGRIQVVRQDDTVRLEVERVAFEKSWPAMLWDAPHVGRIVVNRPQIHLVLSELKPPATDPADASDKPAGPPWTLSAEVHGAAIRIRTPDQVEPAVVLEDLDLSVRILESDRGRTLCVEPVTVMVKQDVTSELCAHGLQLVAPILADAVHAEGHVTLDITECSLPLDVTDPQRQAELTTIRGVVRLDDVKTGLKNPLLLQLSQIVSGMLDVQLPSILQVADDTEVVFEVRDGRVHHEGLAFLLPELSPDLVWRTRGGVGLDESLDLTIEAQIPLTMIHDSPLFRQLSERPLELRVTGTIDEPKIGFPENQHWLATMMATVTGDGGERARGFAHDGDSLSDSILGLVGEAVEQMGADAERPRSGSDPPDFPLLDRLRSLRQSRDEAAGDQESADDEPPAPRLRLFPRRLFQRREEREPQDETQNDQA